MKSPIEEIQDDVAALRREVRAARLADEYELKRLRADQDLCIGYVRSIAQALGAFDAIKLVDREHAAKLVEIDEWLEETKPDIHVVRVVK